MSKQNFKKKIKKIEKIKLEQIEKFDFDKRKDIPYGYKKSIKIEE